MAGYTPLFSSLTTGTLCGRWPDIGLWPIVLSMADKDGVVDVTPAYIAGVTGLPLPDVVACMKRFCEPDPYSRSTTDNGARLILLDDHRDWGWRIVNHGRYREKARLAAKNAREVEEGRNRERMQSRPPVTAGDRRSPPGTAADPLSNANANTNEEKTTTARSAPREPAKPKPVSRETSEPDWFLDFKLAYPERAGDQGWRKALRAANARFAEGHTPAEMIAGARRYRDFCAARGDLLGSEFVKQAATFLGPDKPFLLPWHPPPKPETAMDRLQRMTSGETDDRVIEHESEFGKFLAHG